MSLFIRVVTYCAVQAPWWFTLCFSVSLCMLLWIYFERFFSKTRIQGDKVVKIKASVDQVLPEHVIGAEELAQVPFVVEKHSAQEMFRRSDEFYREMNKRRSLRSFSAEPVPFRVIENIIKTAGTSPSGAHMQPWTFAVVSNAQLKAALREIVEYEEYINYTKRMSSEWVKDLEPFKTNWVKEYIETAPYVIVVLKQVYGNDANGDKKVHYYNEISVCIAVGLMLAAIQNAGLVTLTSTPLNAGPQICKLLDRPVNEKVVLLLPVGYPAENATVPDLYRKPAVEIMACYH